MLSEQRREQIEESFAALRAPTSTWSAPRRSWRCFPADWEWRLPADRQQMLEHIHFSRLGRTRAGGAGHSVGSGAGSGASVDRDLSHLELETAARYLNENFRGWPVERIRTEVARRIEEERGLQPVAASVEELCRKGALARRRPTLYVDGMANLIGAEVDRKRLREMLLALEAKQRLVELLTAYVDGRQQEVRVVVGLEQASPAMQDLVLIGAPTRLGNANLGTVALIAPTRIQYQEMIHAVRYIAQLSERILETAVRLRASSARLIGISALHPIPGLHD